MHAQLSISSLKAQSPPAHAASARAPEMAVVARTTRLRERRRLLLLLCAAAFAAGEEEDAALEKENEELKQRLQILQERIKEEEQYSYVVTRGYIAGAENVYMETMDVMSAKQWCNSNANCFGFTFLGGEGDEQGEDEVKPQKLIRTFIGPRLLGYCRR